MKRFAVFASIILLFSLSAAYGAAREGLREYIVIASLIRWQVDIDKVDCLSLNRKIANNIFKRDYSADPRILSTLHDFFPNKRIKLDELSCPFKLDFNIIVSETRAVTHLGQNSQLLMTFQICEQDDTGALGHKCSYKNLYLFRNDLTPLEAFKVGLKAFLSVQQSEWETMVISLPTST